MCCLLCALYIRWKVPVLQLGRRWFVFDGKLLRKTVSYGWVSAMQQATVQLGKIAVQAIVNTMGVSAMAAFTAASRIDDFAYTPQQNIAHAMTTFMAQNEGAGKKDRVKDGYRCGMRIEVVYALGLMAVCLIFAEPIIRLFVTDPEVVDLGVRFLRTISLFYLMPAATNGIQGFFRGIGDLAHHRTPNPVPPARRLILLIIVGTLPLFVMVPFRRFFTELSDNMYFIGGALIVTGILLFASDRVRHGRKTEKTATMLDALLVGIGQAIALCPGISRSGMTITAGCFTGFERKFAVRFAFLLSIPAVLGANILTLKDAIDAGIDFSSVPVYLVGVVVAAVSGYASIRLLRYIADKGRFGAFAYYCWAAGVLTLVLTILH